MNPKFLKLASEFLEKASNEFSNHGCNDWDWPEDWTEQDRAELLADPRLADKETMEHWMKVGPPDWLVMSSLARIFMAAGKN